jgi:hypothetical protein
LYARKIIAYKLSNRIDTQLAVDTLNLAIANRRKSAGIIFHSDRGAQFTSKCFRKHLDELDMIPFSTHFFVHFIWMKHKKSDEYVAYDVTSVSSYSKNITELEWGYNRDKESCPK